MLLADYQAMPRIADLAQPLLRIAGLRITPRTNGRQQLMFHTALSLVSLKDGKTRPVALPEGIKMGFPQWSHDGRSIAFARYKEDGAEVWVVNAATAEAKALTPAILNIGVGLRVELAARQPASSRPLDRRGPGQRSPAAGRPGRAR